LRRGEIWTIAGGPDYAGKPRPAVVVQDDRFDSTASVTICAFTSNPTEGPLSRPLIEPSDLNKLRQASRIMVDKIATIPRRRLGVRLGKLDSDDIGRLERALLIFLGMAGPLPDRQNGRK
jgi:mRNA interferase MazF